MEAALYISGSSFNTLSYNAVPKGSTRVMFNHIRHNPLRPEGWAICLYDTHIQQHVSTLDTLSYLPSLCIDPMNFILTTLCQIE